MNVHVNIDAWVLVMMALKCESEYVCVVVLRTGPKVTQSQEQAGTHPTHATSILIEGRFRPKGKE